MTRASNKVGLTLAAGVLTAAGLAAPGVAWAQDENASAVSGAAQCPPGSWFCSDAPADAKPPAPAEAKPEAKPAEPKAAPGLSPLPPPDAEPEATKPAPKGEEKSESVPPVVVYQPPPPVMVVPPSGEVSGTTATRRRHARGDKPEWGLHLNVTGTLLGSGAAKGAGLVYICLGLRYRPIPYFALQGSVSFLGGRDYYATARGETAFMGNFYVFLNPKDSFQLFLLGGFGWSTARIGDDRNGNPGPGYNYNYFGGMAGGGAEWRIAKHFALYGDVRAFLRSRTDAFAALEPEFVDSYGRTSNTSAGGLFSGGMTFYF